MKKKYLKILTNIIGAVESGGQIYGKRNYAAYAARYQNSDKEHTCTLGWVQNYGYNAMKLIQRIFEKDPTAFRKADTAGIESKMKKDWVAMKWNPSDAEKKALIAIITTDAGKEVQDEMFMELLEDYIEDAKNFDVVDVPSQMMWCEIQHLGGKGPTERIFKRAATPYTPDSIFASLMLDQKDTSNSNQVGDKIYQSRHECCVKWIKQYVMTDDQDQAPAESVTEGYTREMENLAKDDSHGYDQIYRWGEKGDFDCSAAVIQCLENNGIPAKSNGATYTGNMLPVLLKLGFVDVKSQVNTKTADGMIRSDILLNRDHHVAVYCGNGKEVEASINEKGTATGGTPGDQTGREFLIRSYRDYPWTNILRYKGTAKVPTFNAIGTKKSTVDDLFVRSEPNGYVLGSINKGDKVEVDGTVSGKWTHVMVDGIGIGWIWTGYLSDVSQNKSDSIKGKQNQNEVLFVGRVTADILNVRTWAGTGYPNIQSYPQLAYGNLIDVMNYTQKATDGTPWYFVRILMPDKKSSVKGFVSSKFIERV